MMLEGQPLQICKSSSTARVADMNFSELAMNGRCETALAMGAGNYQIPEQCQM